MLTLAYCSAFSRQAEAEIEAAAAGELGVAREERRVLRRRRAALGSHLVRLGEKLAALDAHAGAAEGLVVRPAAPAAQERVGASPPAARPAAGRRARGPSIFF